MSLTITQKINDHDATLQELETRLGNDLPAIRPLVYTVYPHLEKALEKSPEHAKKFEAMLSKTWVQRTAMTQLARFSASKMETLVLEKLGLNMPANVEVLRTALTKYTRPEDMRLEALKKDCVEEVKSTRLKLAGVPEGCIDETLSLIDDLSKLQQELERISSEKCAQKAKELCADSDIAQNCVYGKLRTSATKKIRAMIAHEIENAQLPFSERIQALVKTQTKIKEKIEEALGEVDEDCVKFISWVNEYIPALGKDFIEDSEDDSFRQGTCFAQCFNLCARALDDEREVFVPRSVTAQDRFVQLLHFGQKSLVPLFASRLQKASEIDEKTALSNGRLPEQYLNKQNIQMALLSSPDDDNIELYVEQLLDLVHMRYTRRLSSDNVVLAWRSHAVCMRYNFFHGIYRIFDPNIGTLRFIETYRLGEEPVAKRMARAYVDLYRVHYSKFPDYGLVAYQWKHK